MTDNDGSEAVDWDLLGLYISDHISGATAGIQRIGHMAREYADTPHGPALKRMESQFRAERGVLQDLLAAHDQPRRRHRQIIAWLGERLGRLKMNGRLLHTSPMTPVLESELMRAAVLGKIGGWQTLGAYADQIGMSTEEIDRLISQAEGQIAALSELHQWARERAFLSGARLPLR